MPRCCFKFDFPNGQASMLPPDPFPLVIFYHLTCDCNSEETVEVSSLQTEMQALIYTLQVVLSNFLNISVAV